MKRPNQCLIPLCEQDKQANSPHCPTHQPLLPMNVRPATINEIWQEASNAIPVGASKQQYEGCKIFFFMGMQAALQQFAKLLIPQDEQIKAVLQEMADHFQASQTPTGGNA